MFRNWRLSLSNPSCAPPQTSRQLLNSCAPLERRSCHSFLPHKGRITVFSVSALFLSLGLSAFGEEAPNGENKIETWRLIMKSEIQQKLETLAFNRTTPFCYGCYVQAPKGICPECHSDDLSKRTINPPASSYWAARPLAAHESSLAAVFQKLCTGSREAHAG